MISLNDLRLDWRERPGMRAASRMRRSSPVILNYGRLRLLPFWDPLSGDPRFEKIVASLAPKEANK